MPAPAKIIELVEHFEMHGESYQSSHYNETQLRREFIEPFFKSLGWDVDNEKGWADAYKDVIHEDAIRIGGMTKAPDSCFRIGGLRKYFVETKKPSVNIRGVAGSERSDGPGRLVPGLPFVQTRPRDARSTSVVYELYGLTDEEIQIVEEATK